MTDTQKPVPNERDYDKVSREELPRHVELEIDRIQREMGVLVERLRKLKTKPASREPRS